LGAILKTVYLHIIVAVEALQKQSTDTLQLLLGALFTEEYLYNAVGVGGNV